MPAHSKMVEIEEREQKPLREILADRYREHGKQTDVAASLGISQSTLSMWLLKLGLVERTTLVPRESVQQRVPKYDPRNDTRTIEEIPIWE